MHSPVWLLRLCRLIFHNSTSDRSSTCITPPSHLGVIFFCNDVMIFSLHDYYFLCALKPNPLTLPRASHKIKKIKKQVRHLNLQPRAILWKKAINRNISTCGFPAVSCLANKTNWLATEPSAYWTYCANWTNQKEQELTKKKNQTSAQERLKGIHAATISRI